jgi:putative hemolysin
VPPPRRLARSLARRILVAGGPLAIRDLAIIVALTLVSGLLAGAEIAVVAFRRGRLADGRARDSRLRAVRALRSNPDRFFATVQIGITVIGAAAAAFGGASFSHRLAPLLQRAGLGPEASDAVALAIVVAALSFLSLVLGELVPKSLALKHSERYALVIARPLLALGWLVRPLVRLVAGASNLILRLFGDHTTFSEARLTADELRSMVEEARAAGSVDPEVGELASRAIEISDLTVADIMVPRHEIVSVARDATLAELKRIALEEGRSRMPVYDGTPDNVVGYLVAKDLLRLDWNGETVVLADLVRPAHFVPETMRAIDLLDELRQRRLQLAIVVDEQGALAGLVTVEDVVEEVVGEIVSEREEPKRLVHREPDGALLVPGSASVRSLNREAGLHLPEGDTYSTIAGLCLALEGAIPPRGRRFDLDDGTTLEVADASPRRVRSVRIRKSVVVDSAMQ